jgi:hypothetical protein
MADPVFPATLPSGATEDASKFNWKPEDPAMKTTMEGGYVVSRPKHTRKPRKTFKSGFTHIRDVDRATLLKFYEDVHGGSLIFDYTDPTSPLNARVVYKVRFVGDFAWKFAGIGAAHLNRWDVEFTVEQA